jgi:TolB-like protein
VLYVVARHSSFAYKGEKVDIKEVAEKLGVQYIVEGSAYGCLLPSPIRVNTEF